MRKMTLVWLALAIMLLVGYAIAEGSMSDGETGDMLDFFSNVEIYRGGVLLSLKMFHSVPTSDSCFSLISTMDGETWKG